MPRHLCWITESGYLTYRYLRDPLITCTCYHVVLSLTLLRFVVSSDFKWLRIPYGSMWGLSVHQQMQYLRFLSSAMAPHIRHICLLCSE